MGHFPNNIIAYIINTASKKEIKESRRRYINIYILYERLFNLNVITGGGRKNCTLGWSHECVEPIFLQPTLRRRGSYNLRWES